MICAPLIPVVCFGDVEQCFRSRCRIISVGINPSSSEFSDRHFPKEGMELVSGLEKSTARDETLYNILNNYYRNRPYRWFRSFEKILKGMVASYGGEMSSHRGWVYTAVHADICTPLVTELFFVLIQKKKSQIL